MPQNGRRANECPYSQHQIGQTLLCGSRSALYLSLDIGADNPQQLLLAFAPPVKSAISSRLEISAYSILTSVVHLPSGKVDLRHILIQLKGSLENHAREMILLQETGITAHLEVTQDLPDIVRDICGIMGGTSQNHQGERRRSGAKGHHHRRGVANYEWTPGRQKQLINPYLHSI